MSFFNKLFKGFNKIKEEESGIKGKEITENFDNDTIKDDEIPVKDDDIPVAIEEEAVPEKVEQVKIIDNKKILYEILEKKMNLRTQKKIHNLSFLQIFESYKIDGFSLINKEERIVGCYYRKENIDEFFSSISEIEDPKFELVLEKEDNNIFDKNAMEISVVYSVAEEQRKLQLGYLSRNIAYYLRDYNNIKGILTKIENDDYNDCFMELFIETKDRDIFVVEKRNEIARYKLQESNFDIAYKYNSLASELEKNKDIDEAILNYEKAVKLEFCGNYPYDRLAILYRKRKDISNEIRVLEKAVSVFEMLDRCSARGDVSPKLSKFKDRLSKVKKMRNKLLK